LKFKVICQQQQQQQHWFQNKAEGFSTLKFPASVRLMFSSKLKEEQLLQQQQQQQQQ
jgi:hypothetical protein